MTPLRIDISGVGTKDQLISALQVLVSSMKDTISLEEQAGAGIVWEDAILLTTIAVD